MLINADCTLYRYENGGYNRYVINNVYWCESKAGNVLKSGLQTADSTSVYFYSDKIIPQTVTKDMLVKGVCNFEFDNSSQKSVSESMQSFRKAYNFVTVMSVDNCMYGGLPHIEVSAR